MISAVRGVHVGAADKPLLGIPVSQLGVKCVACGTVIAPDEAEQRCSCGALRVRSQEEVIVVRHRAGQRPFEIDRMDVLKPKDDR